uniref:uncharacterized protein LOC122767679 isoform X3 n=1 Tax=Solea senegalensis TaxID=28829 RepID=UPI001CD85ACE|nr:uncharacterized protein LOC122767679 isoform X3 [Solea senegalensis]
MAGGQRLFVVFMYSLRVIAVDAYYFRPPKLTVDTSVMTETDTVTLFCYSKLVVSECYFYTVNPVKTKTSSCGETLTLTGSELLWMVNQSAPTVVRVKCFYTVKKGDLNSPSEHSDVSSITINARREETTELHTTQTLTTGLTVRPHVSTPATPIKGLTIKPYFSTPATPKAGLTVSRPHVSTALTPIKGLTVSRPHVPTSATTIKAGLTVSRPHVPTSATTIKEVMTLKLLLVVIITGFVVTLVLFLLVLVCTMRRRGRRRRKRRISGSEKANKQEPQKEDSDTPVYHLYEDIVHEPPAPALKTTELYDLLQPH